MTSFAFTVIVLPGAISMVPANALARINVKASRAGKILEAVAIFIDVVPFDCGLQQSARVVNRKKSAK